jgi:hypothetical protein
MNILVQRYKHAEDFTLGKVFIDGEFECYSLEDEKREQKVMHETRIPEGSYKVVLRTFGGHHERYEKKFPNHEGMLWVTNVPNFKDILIHIGNTDEDTSGCLLVGLNVDEAEGTLQNSTEAYKRLYKKVLPAAKIGNLNIKYESV